MRMWNINPKFLCRQHLLGEHLEMHMFAGCIRKGKNIQGYIDKGLVEIHNIKKRHDTLADEMATRGYNHKSDLQFEVQEHTGKIDIDRSTKDLQNRCRECFNEEIQS